jgi:hypothetical protein
MSDPVETLKKNLNGRPNKKNLYMKERGEILAKIYQILGITNDNKVFYLWDLDNDKTKQESILALKDDVKKYFSASNWSVYTRPDVNRPYISFIKCMFSEIDLKYIISTKSIMRNNSKVKSQAYFIMH